MSIVVNTNKGRFGCFHKFEAGLNIVRANNSAGKSTVLRSLTYALGLEGMFSPSHEVPLPHVLTEYIDLPDGNAIVLNSHVSVEIYNGENKALTVWRSISGDRDRHLIAVQEGEALTDPKNAGPATDYFVRTNRAAQSERGFHNRLAKFMNWEVPDVATFEGGTVPLYMELLFPLLNVEQKLGWGRVPARFPTWLGVKDVRRRTVEFLLGLDAYGIAEERLAVQLEMSRIRNEWSALRTNAARRAVTEGAILSQLPEEPIATWPPQIPPQIFLGTSQSGFEGLPLYLHSLRQRQSELRDQPLATAGEANQAVRSALSETEDAISEREVALRHELQNLESGISEVEALKERIDSLKEDQRKYKDLRRLRDLGSDRVYEELHGSCPTCHQAISDSLMDLSRRSITMSVDQNISFYDEQLQLSEAVLENAQKSISVAEAQVVVLRQDLENLRDKVRAYRQTLTSPESTPSIELLSERLRLDQRVSRLEDLLDTFKDTTATFASLTDDWQAVLARLKKLPKGATSMEDETKLNGIQNSLQSQLVSYGFRSVSPNLVTVSRDYYEPELSDMNLAADAAASDVIRLQWAYLLALLQVSRTYSGNHPGILIMDEPQQQSVEDNDFFKMLQYSSRAPDSQVIIGTSHDAKGIDDFVTLHPSVHLWEAGTSHLITKFSDAATG